ncbi:MAG: allophanate hydrolase [Rhodospirillaceae bacterium]
MKPLRFTFPEIRAAYRAGAHVGNVVQEAVRRADAYADPAVWISRIRPDDLTARVTALEGLDEQTRGKMPLYGMPCAIKDNMDLAGYDTTAACPAYAYAPKETAFAVRRLEAAGAVIIGKANMDQFATGTAGVRSPYGIPRSVFGRDYVCGGSSSGSAVAVAAGIVAFALGSDTAGSGRIPAAFNNIVGLKPTRGIISASGVVPCNRTLDCVAVLAHSVEDSMEVLDALAEMDPADAYSRVRVSIPPAPSGPFSFAVPRRADLEFYGDIENARMFDAAVAVMEGIGGRKVEIDFAPFREAGALLYGAGFIAERVADLGAFIEAHQADVHPNVVKLILGNKDRTAVEVFKGQHRLEALKREVGRIFSGVDFLLVPTSPLQATVAEVEADPIALPWKFSTYTGFGNILDLAAFAVPAGINRRGLPFGVQLVGPIFTEARMAPLAGRFMKAVGGFTGAPPA